jgi:hypothetical protein
MTTDPLAAPFAALPGTVTITTDEIIIDGWTFTGVHEKENQAIEAVFDWAVARLRAALTPEDPR